MIKYFNLNEKTYNMSVKDYLKKIHNYSSRSLKNSKITIDNKPIKKNKLLPKNGILKLEIFEKDDNIKAIKMDIDIVYEDENLLIINKEPFLLTHPSLKKVDITLANAIKYHYPDILPRFINRLDMNTSGLIMIAKNSFTQNYMQNKNNILKKYLAICEGNLKNQIVEKNILKFENSLERIIDNKGQYAKTEFKLIRYFPNLDLSLVEATLFTGRTHQIRVHLKHIGHPLIGDTLYNPNSIYNKIANRQMLHSYYLEFKNPKNNEIIKIKIKPYKDMIDLLEL